MLASRVTLSGRQARDRGSNDQSGLSAGAVPAGVHQR